MNAAFERVWGRRREELDLSPDLWIDSVHPEDRQRVASGLADWENGGAPAGSYEYRVVRPDGAIAWIEDHGTTLSLREGLPALLCGVARDVTRHRETEAELRQSGERAELLARAAERLLVTSEPEQAAREICDEVGRHLGCDLVTGWLREPLTGRLLPVLTTDLTSDGTGSIVLPDGNTVVCRRSASTGEVAACPGTATDGGSLDGPGCPLGMRSCLAYPLRVGERVLGTLSFGSRSPRRFEPQDAALMKAVADLVAVAIGRVENERDLERRVLARTSELTEANRRLAVEVESRVRAQEALEARAEELRARNEELVRFNRTSVGREIRMVELKGIVNTLSRELGRPEPFSRELVEAAERIRGDGPGGGTT